MLCPSALAGSGKSRMMIARIALMPIMPFGGTLPPSYFTFDWKTGIRIGLSLLYRPLSFAAMRSLCSRSCMGDAGLPHGAGSV
jgi:hypothetical protein